MKQLLIAAIALCMTAGCMVFAGCKDSGKDNSAALLMLQQQQRLLYEIPKGVAE